MKSPIVFQDLEKELQPVMKYLHGHVLNAGCGQRDLSSFLRKHGATKVDNCDRKTPIQDAIICDLVDVPKESESYDAILCNAVLEHVQFPDRVMSELRRLVKPTGYLVLSIPFLQPYHPEPDYRRYTREGMLELARIHELETVEILPVHTIAQTLTWIGWSYLEEKRARLLRLLLWGPLYLWNRFSQSTDFDLRNQANGFQMVLRKPSHNGNGNGNSR
jgi:SAM-dependent methyltransferase